MKHFDEEMLGQIRELPCCWCGKYAPSEACHIFAKGAGNSSQLDVPFNLVPMCLDCHASQHSGGRPLPREMLALASARCGMLQDDAERRIRLMQRAPSDCTVCKICKGCGGWRQLMGVQMCWYVCPLCDGVGILNKFSDPYKEVDDARRLSGSPRQDSAANDQGPTLAPDQRRILPPDESGGRVDTDEIGQWHDL